MSQHQRILAQQALALPEENDDWKLQLSLFESIELPADAWIALCGLCVDVPDKFFSFLELILHKGIPPSSLIPTLRLFFFSNSSDEALRKRFYQLFRHKAEQNADSSIAQLYQLAKTNFLKLTCYSNSRRQEDIRNGGPPIYYSLNLFEDLVSTGTKKINCQDDFSSEYSKKPDLNSLLENFKVLWQFFGGDILSLLKVESVTIAEKLFRFFYSLIEAGEFSYTKLLLILQERSLSGKEFILEAMANFYSQPAEFNNYLNIASQYPGLLFLIHKKGFSDAQHKAIAGLSERTFEAMIESKIYVRADKIFKLFLIFFTVGRRNHAHENKIKNIFEKGIIKQLFLLSKERNAADLPDIQALKECPFMESIYPSIKACVIQWHEELKNAVGDFAHMVALWRSHENERTFLKSIFPALRDTNYPYDIHELVAIYLEERFLQSKVLDLKEAFWPIVKEELYFYLDDTTAEDAHWKRGLVSAFLHTKNPSFRNEVVISLYREFTFHKKNNPDLVKWWLPPFWPGNKNAIDDFRTYNGVDALKPLQKELLEISSRVEVPIAHILGIVLVIGGRDLLKIFFDDAREGKGLPEIQRLQDELLKQAIEANNAQLVNCLFEFSRELTLPATELIIRYMSYCDVSSFNYLFTKIKSKYSEDWWQKLLDNRFKSLVVANNFLSIEQLFLVAPSYLQTKHAYKAALEFAIEKSQPMIVKCLLERANVNSLNRQEVERILESNYKGNKPEIVTLILLSFQTSNQPSKRIVTRILEYAARQGDLTVVKTILSLKTSNRPSRRAITRVLKSAISSRLIQWDVVLAFMKMTGLNKPTRRVVNRVLAVGTKAGKYNVIQSLLAMKGFNRPSKRSINRALEFEVTAKYPQWELVCSMLALTGFNKPSRRVVNRVLAVATKAGKYNVIQSLLAMKGFNQPSQRAIHRAIEFEVSSRDTQWELVYFILAIMGTRKPSYRVLSGMFKAAVTAGASEVVLPALLSSSFWELNRRTVEIILKHAATNRKITALKQILSKNLNNKAHQSVVMDVLQEVISNTQFDSSTDSSEQTLHGDIVKFLLQALPINKHTHELFKHTLGVASTWGNTAVVLYILGRYKNTKYYLPFIAKVLSQPNNERRSNVIEAVVDTHHIVNIDDPTLECTIKKAIIANQDRVIDTLLSRIQPISKHRSLIIQRCISEAIVENKENIVISMLSRLASDNQYQTILSEIYRHAAQKGQWQFIERLYQTDHGSYLHDSLVSFAFQKAAEQGKWDALAKLLTGDSKNQIKKTGLKSVLPGLIDAEQWAFVWDVLLLLKNNKQAKARTAYDFLKAAYAMEFDKIKESLEGTENQRPDLQTFTYIVNRVVAKENWSMFSFLLMQPEIIALTPERFRELFQKIIDCKQWDVASTMLKENAKALTFNELNYVLISAVRLNQIGLIEQLVQLAGVNSPSAQGVNNAFLLAVQSSHGLIKYFLESSDLLQPSIASINTAIHMLLRASQWEIIFEVLKLTKHKPDHWVMDLALEKAIINRQLGIADQLLDYREQHQIRPEVTNYQDKAFYDKAVASIARAARSKLAAKQRVELFAEKHAKQTACLKYKVQKAVRQIGVFGKKPNLLHSRHVDPQTSFFSPK